MFFEAPSLTNRISIKIVKTLYLNFGIKTPDNSDPKICWSVKHCWKLISSDGKHESSFWESAFRVKSYSP